jgi:Protein of unknown function (DUF1573)
MHLSLRQAVFMLLVIFWTAALARADLEFAQTTTDAGEVKAGAPLSHTFTFVNRGPGVVEITGIESSCGCLTPRLDQRTFQPGEHGSILVEVNTLSPAPGPHIWQVKLSCRSGAMVSEVPLRLTARLVREIVVEPAAVNMFVDGPMQTEFRLIDPRSKPLQLQEVHTTAPALQAEIAGQERDTSGHLIYKVHLRVTGDMVEGRHEEFVSLFTNDPDYREIKVPVTVVKRSRQRLSATPSRIELSVRPGSSLPSRMVLIRDRENQEVEVEAVSADSPAVTCRWVKGPGAMTTLRVQIDRNQVQDSKWQSTVRVQVAKPTRQTLLIPVVVTSPE